VLEEDGIELRQGRRCNYCLRRLESMAAKELAIQKARRLNVGKETWR